MALYFGAADETQKREMSAEDSQKFMDEVARWASNHQSQLVDSGAPLGKTKRVITGSVADATNQLVAYTLVEAPSHAEAAAVFADHPHLALTPANAIEVMTVLDQPGA